MRGLLDGSEHGGTLEDLDTLLEDRGSGDCQKLARVWRMRCIFFQKFHRGGDPNISIRGDDPPMGS
jgi:hypothetical protein